MLKKLSLFIVVLFFVFSISAKEKLNYELGGLIEIGYYESDYNPDGFLIENAALKVSSDLYSNLRGTIELKYRDDSDTYFDDEKIYLNEISLQYLQKNGGAIIGKYRNLSLPIITNFKKSMGYSLYDNYIGKTNPVGFQYLVKSKYINFYMGYFNGPGLCKTPLYNFTADKINTISFNYEDNKDKSQNEFAGAIEFLSESGFGIKSGYIRSELKSSDIDYLNDILSDSFLNSDDKNLWFISLFQKSKSFYFNASYSKTTLSNLKNKLMNATLTFYLKGNIEFTNVYTYLKYNNDFDKDLLGKKTQYISNMSYKIKENLKVGYEYVWNKQKGVNSKSSKQNLIKIIYKF